jgi:hypothetical protein
VKEASLEELQALKWLPNAVADAVYAKVHGIPLRSGVPGSGMRGVRTPE